VTTPLEGLVVLAESANDPDSTFGCTPLTNAAEMAGRIALIERGGCEFGRKALRAQQAGAIAAIIFNNARPDEENVIPMGPGVDGPSVTIPALHVARSTGLAMIAQTPRTAVRLTALGPDRDSDFDNAVIVHEYTHGISNRLVGGPQNVECLFGTTIVDPTGAPQEVGVVEQMGEGWSDYVALMLTMRGVDSGPKPRGVGSYLLYQPKNGGGIRPARYSTDFSVNAYTYADLPNTEISVPHGVGFIWATILWEMTWEIMGEAATPYRDPYNASRGAGNQVALHLVTTGMKLTPCSPGFVDGRDAILAADEMLYGGAHTAAIWRAFARRGLGYSASQGLSVSRTDGTAAYDLPPATLAATADLGAADGLGGAAFRIAPVSPNPAADRATLAVEVARTQAVRVEVFDALGRRVALVHDGELAAGARHALAVEAAALAPGAYVWRATGEDFSESGRLTVVR
jgi:extracellular elastinolytic metalloproteinase